MRFQSPYMSLLGALQGFLYLSYACSIPPVKQPVNATSESLTGASYAFLMLILPVNAAFWEPCRVSCACSIPPVKQPVNAAFGSLLICLCRIWEDGSHQYSRECQQGERPLSQLGISDIEQASNDAEPGQQYPPQGGKSRELRGVQRPLAKYGDNKSLVSLYFATAIAD